MPVSNVTNKYIPAIDKKITDLKPKIDLWRTAIRAGFSDIFYVVINGGKPKEDKWLKKMEMESPKTFIRRAHFAEDPGWSGKIIMSYSGHFSRAEYTSSINYDDKELEETINDDFDGNGTNFKRFYVSIFEEMISVGETWAKVDAIPIKDEKNETIAVKPFVTKICRENIMDYEESKIEKGFEWVKYKNYTEKRDGLKKETIEQIIIVDKEYWYIAEKDTTDGKWKVIDKKENTIKKVPIVRFKFGSDGLPIINTIAKYQLDMMNIQNETRNTISIQGLNNLQMSKSMAASVKKWGLKTASIFEFEDNSPDRASWIGPNPSTLEPNKWYIAHLIETIVKMANLRQNITNQAESADSKAWDWLDVEAVLNFGADITENGVIDIFNFIGLYLDKSLKPQFEIIREFLFQDLEQYLNNVLLGKEIGVGETAEKELSKKVRDLLIKLNPKLKKKSDAEIDKLIQDQIIAKQDFDNLFENKVKMETEEPENEPEE
jgi:hypothetical protein